MENWIERMLKTITNKASLIYMFMIMVVAIFVGTVLYLFDPKRHFENR